MVDTVGLSVMKKPRRHKTKTNAGVGGNVRENGNGGPPVSAVTRGKTSRQRRVRTIYNEIHSKVSSLHCLRALNQPVVL